MKRSPRYLTNQRGVALVITLAVLGAVVLLAMGFAISMRTEQIAARTYSHSALSRQLADGAVDEAIFLIRTNTPVILQSSPLTTYWVSRPGQILRHGPVADDLMFSVFSPLSSAGTFNMNLDSTIITNNTIYDTATKRQIFVDWITIGTNGQSAAAGNPIIGRYAYWVDDEASKINVNSAQYRVGTSASTNGASMADVNLTALTDIGVVRANSSYAYANTNGFFTTEHWKSADDIGSAIYEKNKFFITAHSNGLDFTPWGTKRKNLNNTSDATIGFVRADIDTPITTLTNTGLAAFFNYGAAQTNTFARKYRADAVKQILANIYDFRQPDGPGVTVCSGAENAYLDTGGAGWQYVPKFYCGLRRYPFLNEIGVRVAYCTPTGGNGLEIQAKAHIYVELVNPYDQDWTYGGQIRVYMDKLRFRVVGDGGAWQYDTGPDTGWTTGWDASEFPYQSSNELVANVPTIPANSYAVVELTAFAGRRELNATAYVDQIAVRIAKVRFLQTANNNETIRDWAIQPDFDQQICAVGNFTSNHFCFASGSAGVEPIPLAAGCPASLAINNDRTQAIAKNDPRVRRFTSWTPPLPAWYRVGYDTTTNVTLGSENTGVVDFTGGNTGYTNLPKDPSETGVNVVDRSTFPAFATRDYESIGELGYIHTGLQWRTLWMLPESNTSSNYVPDWAVLDIFSVTNTSVQGRININGAVTTNLTSATMPLRLLPIAALGTNLNLSGVSALPVANIATQGFNTAFTGRYYAPNFFTNAYTMIGQICEVDGLTGSSGTRKALRESWVRALANLITVRSEQFTIWAIGQAIQDVNNNGVFDSGTDLILGESKVRTVVTRFQSAGSDGLWGTSDDTVEYRALENKYLQ